MKNALSAFDALSQETRLKVFRFLVEYGPDGVPAGMISESLKIPHNTLSFHLTHMSQAGLILSRREGRSIIYSANFEFFIELIQYMIKDCCRADMASVHLNTEKNCRIIELFNCCQPVSQENAR